MNRLIVACEGDILTDRDAITAVRNPQEKEKFRQHAARREVFINDASIAIRALGGHPLGTASAGAWARSFGRHARALVAGWNEGDAYAACVDSRRHTARSYAKALKAKLPDDARFGVTQQLAEVEADLRALEVSRGDH